MELDTHSFKLQQSGGGVYCARDAQASLSFASYWPAAAARLLASPDVKPNELTSDLGEEEQHKTRQLRSGDVSRPQYQQAEGLATDRRIAPQSQSVC
ncbi:MAG: hypothetical protein ACKESB_02430 [Candidatus Hodgkinia cicadicola]